MDGQNEEKTKIEGVKEELYSKKTDGIFLKKRHELKEKAPILNTSSTWAEDQEKTPSKIQIPYSKVLLGAFIFFILATGFTIFKYFIGSNTVSGDNINILISGPVSVAGGEILPLDLKIQNNNSTDLKAVNLRIDYPDGTRSSEDLSSDMKRYTENLGDLMIGKNVERIIKTVLFGEENTQKIIKVTVEYRVAGSNAIFSKEKDYTVLISSSPVNITVDGPDEVNANQGTDFFINIKSNSLTIIKNLILKADYPFGFNLTSTNPKPSLSDGNIFILGDLAPGAERSIRVSGIFQGQNGEERDLKFTVGNPDTNDNKSISTPFAAITKIVNLKQSFIGLDFLINQNADKEISIDAGSKASANISWQNNLPENVYNVVIKVKFIGNALDKTSINTSDGFYNSSDNSITYDKNKIPELGTVGPGAEGNMGFDFSTIMSSANSSSLFNNSSITLNISVSGTRTGGNGPEILFADTRVLKISSSLKLLSRGFRSVGPFENSGPFPPKVDNETTYTITWTATNSFNNISGAKVSAILPQGVKWTGFTSPDSENIIYDKSSGRIDWNVGDLRSFTGVNSPAREVSFQVAVTPSISQVGTDLDLLNEATISGTDTFSGAVVGETKSGVTTNITSDPQYFDEAGKVTN